MLNKIDTKRLDSAIKYAERLAFDHMNDDLCTILACLYDYRREMTKTERKHNAVSQ